MTLSVAGTRRDAGVSVAEVNLLLAWNVVSQMKVGERGQAYVIDAGGRLIAHPHASLVLSNTDMTQLAQVQAARAWATRCAGCRSGIKTEVQEGQDLQSHKVLSAYAQVYPLGWLVFVELPVEEASGISTTKLASIPGASSKATSRQTYRSNRPPSSNSSSISKPPKPSASPSRKRCWLPPTRRRSLDHVEHLFAEGAHELFRIGGANAPNHPGREVFLEALGRRRG
jgi:hypothetical protein